MWQRHLTVSFWGEGREAFSVDFCPEDVRVEIGRSLFLSAGIKLSSDHTDWDSSETGFPKQPVLLFWNMSSPTPLTCCWQCCPACCAVPWAGQLFIIKLSHSGLWPGPHSGYSTCDIFGVHMYQLRPPRTSWNRHRVNKLIYSEQAEVWAEPGFPISRTLPPWFKWSQQGRTVRPRGLHPHTGTVGPAWTPLLSWSLNLKSMATAHR